MLDTSIMITIAEQHSCQTVADFLGALQIESGETHERLERMKKLENSLVGEEKHNLPDNIHSADILLYRTQEAIKHFESMVKYGFLNMESSVEQAGLKDGFRPTFNEPHWGGTTRHDPR